MAVEYLVLFYLLVSVSLIAFNLAYALGEGVRGRAAARRERHLGRAMDALVARHAEAGRPEEAGGLEGLSGRGQRRLLRRLRRPSGMEALDHALEGLSREQPGFMPACLASLAPVLERVVSQCRPGHDLERAHACYLVRRWYVVRPAPTSLLHSLLAVVREGSLFARQNALEALAVLGDAPALVEAVVAAQEAQVHHHPRLITETLMGFAGETSELVFLLESQMPLLAPYAQVAVINYLRMSHQGERDGLLMLMDDGAADVEVRLACVRYFMTNPWEGARASLLRYAAGPYEGRWQGQAVAATALGSYPGKDTVRVLEGCLRSPVWFVRNDAAQSLRRLGVSAGEALAAAEDDAYAREMVLYRWDVGGEGTWA